MSNLAGSSYPTVDDSKSTDKYTIVRDGNVKKQSRSGIADYIKGQALSDMRNGGITSNRPQTPAAFEFYFDTTLGKPIWWDGAQWVDATGVAA